ncbi:MAG TPA: hypothetical protein VM261_10410 [Kofleriaceae bacterium]|nr:hypothetical protein [Kofleriaceae bacterium]
MRLVLSRKGFDSTAGGCASPILPDGTMVSLPIPDEQSGIRYGDVGAHGHDVGALVADLTGRAYTRRSRAHLDPDLVAGAFPRMPGWRPLFGQAGGEQTVLSRAGVGRGDLFLFFGWFRRVERVRRRWRFVAAAPDEHVIWGWLRVDEVIDAAGTPPTWAAYHPHVTAGRRWSNNTLYAADDAGTFTHHDDRLRLTRPGASRSRWSLPAWFAPGRGRPPLGYHHAPSRWRRAGDRVHLQSVARGQEFVLDTAHYPEADAWIRSLLG